MTLRSCIGLFALAAPLCMAQGAQSQPAVHPAPSDRKKAGLRGPVKTCVEETTYPSRTDSNGLPSVPFTQRSETDYDEQGRLLASLYHNPDGWSASGKLLKTTSGKEGGPSDATQYAYDDQGRLTSIATNGAPPVIFHYDEQGHKTKVQTSRAEDYRANFFTRRPYSFGFCVQAVSSEAASCFWTLGFVGSNACPIAAEPVATGSRFISGKLDRMVGPSPPISEHFRKGH